jgi:hypothetical protein
VIPHGICYRHSDFVALIMRRRGADPAEATTILLVNGLPH